MAPHNRLLEEVASHVVAAALVAMKQGPVERVEVLRNRGPLYSIFLLVQAELGADVLASHIGHVAVSHE